MSAGWVHGQSYRYAVTADLDSDSVSVVDIDSFTEVGSIPTGATRPITLEVSPSGSEAYVLHAGGVSGAPHVTVIDLMTLSNAGTLPGTIDYGLDLRVSPDGRWLLAASRLEHTLFLYDLPNQPEAPRELSLAVGQGYVIELEISDDSRYAFVSDRDAQRIFQVHLEAFLVTDSVPMGVLNGGAVDLKVHTSIVGPNASYIAYWVGSGWPSTVVLSTWNTSTGQVTSRAAPVFGLPYDLAFDAGSGQLAISGGLFPPVGYLTGGIQIWDLASGTYQTSIFANANSPVRKVQFSQGLFYALEWTFGVHGFDPVAAGVPVVIPTSPSPSIPSQSRVSSDGTRFLFNSGNSITIIDTTSNQVLANVPVSGDNVREFEIAERSGPIGSPACEPAIPNSTGVAASISASGSTSAAAMDVTITVIDLPSNQFGYLIASRTLGFVPNPGTPPSQGNLCILGNQARYNCAPCGQIGQGPSFQLEVGNIPVPTNPLPGEPILPGDTWYWQCWYRDVTSASNFSNAVCITFD